MGRITARSAGCPVRRRFFGAGGVVGRGQRVESARREVELVGGGGGRQGAFTKTCEYMADEGGRVAVKLRLKGCRQPKENLRRPPKQWIRWRDRLPTANEAAN